MPATLEPPMRSSPKVTPPPRLALTPAQSRSRLADYFELTKPRIAVMALITVGVGYLMGAGASGFRWDQLFHVLIGAGLVASGGSALNHGYEKARDGRMKRTANRPGPSGRLSVAEIYAFGITMGVAGLVYLTYSMPHATAAVAAGLTFVLYVFVYTPLKPVTAWNTIVGAVPGALPPIIGWCAARDDLTIEAWELFGILFLWQLPHFYSIAWLHRADYERGGMKMLPVVDHTNGLLTGIAAVVACTLLVGVSVLPTFTGTAGWIYFAGAAPVSLWFLARTIRFAQNRTDVTARTVLRGSLVHLTAVMALFVIDGVVPRFQG